MQNKEGSKFLAAMNTLYTYNLFLSRTFLLISGFFDKKYPTAETVGYFCGGEYGKFTRLVS